MTTDLRSPQGEASEPPELVDPGAVDESKPMAANDDADAFAVASHPESEPPRIGHVDHGQTSLANSMFAVASPPSVAPETPDFEALIETAELASYTFGWQMCRESDRAADEVLSVTVRAENERTAARDALLAAILSLTKRAEDAEREAFRYGIAAQDHNAQHAEDAAEISRLTASLSEARRERDAAWGVVEAVDSQQFQSDTPVPPRIQRAFDAWRADLRVTTLAAYLDAASLEEKPDSE